MKKFIKVMICLLMCFSFGGCFNKMYKRTTKNTIECQDCMVVNNMETLMDNVEKTMDSVDGVKLDYTLVNTKETFKASFDMITTGERRNWDVFSKIHFGDTDMNAYLKDGKLYVIYPHNGANVVLKDDLKAFVNETQDSLDLLNANYDKDNLEEFMLGDKLAGFYFDNLKEKGTYIKNSDGSYLITYKENDLVWEMDVSSKYLFKEVRCSAENFVSVLKFEYPSEVSIEYPMGLDFLTLNIEEAKEVLKVDNFAQIFDKDLKN